MNKNEMKFGFIGCGKMASAIIKGILESGFLLTDAIIASEISQEVATKQASELGIKVFTDNKKIAAESNIIFLATKPHFIKDVLREIKNELNETKIIVSIAAGVSTNTIETEIGQIPVIRVMPNAPAVIQEGMSGLVKGEFATEEQIELIKDILEGIGKCVVLDETQIDVLTAISGSGPAFFYKILHEMALAGDKLGLKYETSLQLAIQTCIGSAKLMAQSELPAQEMISAVATKGGCTQIGVEYLNEVNSEEIFFNLVEKTSLKSKALG